MHTYTHAQSNFKMKEGKQTPIRPGEIHQHINQHRDEEAHRIARGKPLRHTGASFRGH